MIQLYERDAADVSALLTLVADILQGNPDGKKASGLIQWGKSLAAAHSAAIAADHPSQRRNVTAARLTSIVAAIQDQLPPERRVATANAQRPWRGRGCLQRPGDRACVGSGLRWRLALILQGIWLPEHGYSFESTPLWAGIFMLQVLTITEWTEGRR